MCEIAWSHRIRIVLGSVPPASKYWWHPGIEPKAQALALNDWLRGYARSIHAQFADYATPFVDAEGNVKPELARDEVHPTPAGYALMRPIAQAAIDQSVLG
jgi:lysophospholipase L1-like esterase